MVRTLTLTLVVCLLSPAAFAAPNPQKPQVIAVKFHADWCGSCRAMGTAFEDIANKLDGKPALFLTFDLTNQTTRRQAELLAGAMKLNKVWSANSDKSGFVVLVDARTRLVVDRLTSKHSVKEMASAVKRAMRPAAACDM